MIVEIVGSSNDPGRWPTCWLSYPPNDSFGDPCPPTNTLLS